MKKRQFIKNNLSIEKVNKILYTLAYLLFFFLCMELFYRQSISYHGAYRSDLPQHLFATDINREYSIMYRIFDALLAINHSTFYVAILLAATVVASIFVTKQILKQLVSGGNDFVVTVAAFALNLVMAIYVPAVNARLYLGVGSPNIWHNASYTLMKLFAVLTIYFFMKLYRQFPAKFATADWLLFTFSLTMCTLFKPSFVLCFAPAVALLLLVDLIQNKGKHFVQTLILSCSVIPSAIVLATQFFNVYGQDPDSKIAFGFATMIKLYAKHPVIAIFQLAAFPLFVLAFNLKGLLKERLYGIVFLTYLFSLIQAYFLYETGVRQGHLNWVWGYYISVFVFFVYSFGKFYSNIKEKQFSGGVAVIYTVLGSGFILSHLFFGGIYFLKTLLGVSYMNI